MPNLKIMINAQYINNRGDDVTIVSCDVSDPEGGPIYTCNTGIRYTTNGRALPPAVFGDSLVALLYPKKKRPPRK